MHPSQLLDLTPDEVFKDDRRSRVWAVTTPAGERYVVKRFRYHPFRQRLAGLLGIHPAQRERRKHRQLAKRGIAVATIEHHGSEPAGTFGSRYWLATRRHGLSLYNWVRTGGHLADPAARRRFARQLGTTAGRLFAEAAVYRDLKASNFVIDEAGDLLLIDAGDARYVEQVDPREIERVLATLERNLGEAVAKHPNPGAAVITRRDRLRFLAAARTAWPAGKRPLRQAVARLKV